MYFFKDTAGNWILGPESTSLKSKVTSKLRRNSPTVVTVMTIEKTPVLLIDETEVTTIKKNANGDFYTGYADFVEGVSGFFDNDPTTLANEINDRIPIIIYLSENEYQVLLDNDLVLPNVQYNIYE